MFMHLFDFKYERNVYEALAFYFFYVIFGYYFAGLIFYCASLFFYSNNLHMAHICYSLIGFMPFLFYSFLSIAIIFKKKLKDRHNIYLIIYTIAITFIIPLIWGICLGFGFLGYNHGIRYGIIGAFLDSLFPDFLFGCIPVAILTTKEDCSLNKEIQKMEEEKLEQEMKIEKQLLTERATASKIEKIKKHVNNTEEKGETDEEK